MAIVDYFVQSAYALERVLDPAVKFLNLPESLPMLGYSKSVHAERLPLVNPAYVMLLTAFYLVGISLGSWVMRTLIGRRLEVRTFSNFHNAFLVALSAYMGTTIAFESWVNRGYGLFDNAAENTPDAFPLAKYLWLFYFSKVFEFVDTFIMVAKMNFRQISFLHVYHHASIFWVWWLVISVAPTGEAYFSAILNSYIHVVMYSYYLFSSLGLFSTVTRAVKPYITMGQMTQLCCMMVQATYHVGSWYFASAEDRAKKYPVRLSIMLWLYMWTMLGLFANFYIKNYSAKKKASKLEKVSYAKEE